MAIRVKDAFVPSTRTLWVIGIFADRVEQRLEHAKHEWLSILRQEQHMTSALFSYFMGIFRKTAGVSEVHNRAGFYSMSIAAADDELIPPVRQIHNCLVLLPATQST